jgi:hypothetical protein
MPLAAASAVPDFRLPADACDVRGWVVRTLMDRAPVGRVHDLLLHGGVPRYLDLQLDDGGDTHALLPVGYARADLDRRVVWLAGLHRALLASLPRYSRDPAALTRAAEQALLDEIARILAGGHSPPSSEPQDSDEAAAQRGFYDGSRFDLAELYGTAR